MVVLGVVRIFPSSKLKSIDLLVQTIKSFVGKVNSRYQYSGPLRDLLKKLNHQHKKLRLRLFPYLMAVGPIVRLKVNSRVMVMKRVTVLLD